MKAENVQVRESMTFQTMEQELQECRKAGNIVLPLIRTADYPENMTTEDALYCMVQKIVVACSYHRVNSKENSQVLTESEVLKEYIISRSSGSSIKTVNDYEARMHAIEFWRTAWDRWAKSIIALAATGKQPDILNSVDCPAEDIRIVIPICIEQDSTCFKIDIKTIIHLRIPNSIISVYSI